jgi:hypothetical protein
VPVIVAIDWLWLLRSDFNLLYQEGRIRPTVGESEPQEVLFYRRSDSPNPPSDNLILASGPTQEFERLRPYLEFVPGLVPNFGTTG